jgi:hypothetical protein
VLVVVDVIEIDMIVTDALATVILASGNYFIDFFKSMTLSHSHLTLLVVEIRAINVERRRCVAVRRWALVRMRNVSDCC